MIHSPEKVQGRQCGFTLLLNTVIQIRVCLSLNTDWEQKHGSHMERMREDNTSWTVINLSLTGFIQTDEAKSQTVGF